MKTQGLSIFIFLLLFLLASQLKSQQEYTLHFNRDLLQSSHTNPAIKYDYKFSFLFPSVSFNYGNNAFTYDDLIQDHPDFDSTYLDVDGIISQMAENNILQIQSEIDVFGLYYSHRDWFFSFFLSEKYDFRLTYPKKLMELAWNGNAQFIGETVEIGPGIYANYYKELNFGIGRSINKWDVGLKFKLLSGIANVSSIRNSLKLTTDDDNYATTLSSDYEIRTSGLDDPLSNFLRMPKSFANPGFAFDLGAVYHMNEKWEFSQSIIDLGRIRWKDGVKKYSSKGTFEYSGVDIAQFVDEGEFNFDEYRDSLNELYFNESEGGVYQANLVPETFTGVMFTPDDKTHFGAMMNLQFFNGTQFGMSLYAGRQIVKILNMGFSYSIKNRRYDNLGFNLNLGSQEFKIFVVTDNLLTAFNFKNGKNVTWRYGINVNIGSASSVKSRKPKNIEPEILETTNEG